MLPIGMREKPFLLPGPESIKQKSGEPTGDIVTGGDALMKF